MAWEVDKGTWDLKIWNLVLGITPSASLILLRAEETARRQLDFFFVIMPALISQMAANTSPISPLNQFPFNP